MQVADIIAPAGMQFLCTALRYNKLGKLKKSQMHSIYLIIPEL